MFIKMITYINVSLGCRCSKSNIPPYSISPGIINLGLTYRGYIQPSFNIPLLVSNSPRGILNLGWLYPRYVEPSPNVPHDMTWRMLDNISRQWNAYKLWWVTYDSCGLTQLSMIDCGFSFVLTSSWNELNVISFFYVRAHNFSIV